MREIKVKVSFNSGRLHNQSSYVKTGDFNLTKMVFDFDADYGRKYLKIANEQGELIYYDEIINNEVILVGKMVVKALHDNVVYTKYLDKETETNIFWYDPLTNKLYDNEYQEILEFDLEDYEKQYAQGSLFSEEGYYPFEIALYNDQGRITSVDSSLYASKEIIKVDDVYVIDKLPIIDTLIIGYNKAMQDMEDAIKDLIDAKEEAETLIDNFEADVENYTNDFNTNATNKTSAFNQNATEKTTALNEIYEDAVDLKEDYDQDVENATSTLNGIVSSAESTYQAFDTNASEKLSAYNQNAASKLQDYNTNASSKESAYNSNASEKTTAFNTNATSKTTDFNTNATNKLDSYNSNATEKLQDYNDNADDKIEEFDEHAGEIQEEQVIQNKKIATLETIYNALPKVTGEGSDITLNGTANTKMELELEPSELEQETTTQSTNLFDEKYYNNDNLYQLNVYRYTKTKIMGARTLYFKAQVKQGQSQVAGLYVTFSTTPNPNSGEYKMLINTGIIDSGPKNFSNFNDYLYFSFYPANKTLSEIFDHYNIWVSTDDVEYTPFVPDSPSPDYLQDIHVISGDNEIIVSNSDNTLSQVKEINLPVENLFDKDNESQIKNWFVSGTPLTIRENANIKLFYVKCKPNTKYTISKTSSTRLQFWCTTEKPAIGVITSAALNYDYDFTGTIKTITTTNDANWLLCYYYLSTSDTKTEEEIRNSIQLELGTKANSYTPYGTTPLEYCKIGNYKDKFFKNLPTWDEYDSTLEYGKWYLKKNIGKVILDGSENWSTLDNKNTGNTFYSSVSVIDNLRKGGALTLYSNYFKYIRDLWDNNNAVGTQLFNISLALRFRILKTSLSEATMNGWKAWLSTHNTIVYYILETPQYILLNNTLQSQLDAIYEYALSYQEQTNISQVNNDLPFNIKASAVRDISAMFDTITNALLEIGGE